jgi:hypothetical protein
MERARLVARELEALHVGSEDLGAAADLACCAPGALGEQVAETIARADLLDAAQERLAVAETQPGGVDQAALGALHRPRERAAGGDRVDAEVVAERARCEHGVGIRHPAERPEREHVLVLHARAAAAR